MACIVLQFKEKNRSVRERKISNEREGNPPPPFTHLLCLSLTPSVSEEVPAERKKLGDAFDEEEEDGDALHAVGVCEVVVLLA